MPRTSFQWRKDYLGVNTPCRTTLYCHSNKFQHSSRSARRSESPLRVTFCYVPLSHSCSGSKPPSHKLIHQKRRRGWCGSSRNRATQVTQVYAAWTRIVCCPRYSGEYRINCISLLILSILQVSGPTYWSSAKCWVDMQEIYGSGLCPKPKCSLQRVALARFVWCRNQSADSHPARSVLFHVLFLQLPHRCYPMRSPVLFHVLFQPPKIQRLQSNTQRLVD